MSQFRVAVTDYVFPNLDPEHEILGALGAEVVIHDPYVGEYQGDLGERVRGCDAVVVMVAHDEYRDVELLQLLAVIGQPMLIEGRHVFAANQRTEPDWVWCIVGTERS